jgi:uncharacterized OB-fold protein
MKPAPRPTVVSQPFWDGCARRELMFQRCTACERAVFNPAVACRYCGGVSLAWERSQGLGTLYSWSIVWRPQTPSFEVPYCVIIVDLDEGYQMVSNLVDYPPDEVTVGMRVEVEFLTEGDFTLPYFRPAGG